MSALAFDPWAALELQRCPPPLPKAPNPANPTALDLAKLGALAGLGGAGPATAKIPLIPISPASAPISHSLTHAMNVLVRPRAGVPAKPLSAHANAFVAGVPVDWCEGVALLASRPAPDGIVPLRWRAFQAIAAVLLRNQGANLHAARWDTLELFGLHATAPATYPPGWGLAWLLGTGGEVLDISLTAVGLTREAGGQRMAYYNRRGRTRAGIVPAWNLPEISL